MSPWLQGLEIKMRTAIRIRSNEYGSRVEGTKSLALECPEVSTVTFIPLGQGEVESLGDWLEVQIFRPHTDLLRVGPRKLCF